MANVCYGSRLCENYFALPMTSKNAHESSIIGNNCAEAEVGADGRRSHLLLVNHPKMLVFETIWGLSHA